MAEGKSSTLKWVGVGCGVLLLIGACGVASAFFACDRMLSPPVGQARGFFGDLRSGDYASALARTNAAYQSTHTVEAFQVAVTAMPAATGQTDVSFSNRNVEGASATVAGSLATPSGDVPVTVRLSRAGEHWYIDSVTVQGQMLQ